MIKFKLTEFDQMYQSVQYQISYFLTYLPRLDYDVNIVANPYTTVGSIGSCTSANAVDSVVVTSPSGYNPPTICGFNSGQHSQLKHSFTFGQM